MSRFLFPSLLTLALPLLGVNQPSQAVAEQNARLATLRTRGVDASLAILPVHLAGRPFERVSEVLGLLLEQRGLRTIDLVKFDFKPAESGSMDQLAAALAANVQKAPPTTEYVLYAEINGSREKGLNEVRAVLLDRGGNVLWTERLGPEDAVFPKPQERNPMGLSVLLAERLAPRFGLDAATAKAAKPGKMARIMEERSGLPPETERAAIPERLARIKAAGSSRSMVVYAARIGGSRDDLGPEGLVKPIQAAQLAQAKPGGDLLLKSSRNDPNQLKTLWDLAREFREHLRQHPPEADYALYADCTFNPANWEQGYVHIVVCDRKGEWVIVDFQNSHHPDYQAIRPVSAEACRTLAVKRLMSYLK